MTSSSVNYQDIINVYSCGLALGHPPFFLLLETQFPRHYDCAPVMHAFCTLIAISKNKTQGPMDTTSNSRRPGRRVFAPCSAPRTWRRALRGFSTDGTSCRSRRGIFREDLSCLKLFSEPLQALFSDELRSGRQALFIISASAWPRDLQYSLQI